jgi:hypothetical protein
MSEKKDYIEKLTQAVQNEDLVIFVGAGVSKLIGAPSWRELAESYLKHLYDNNGINYSTYEYLSKESTRKLLSVCRQIEKLKGTSPFDIKRAISNRNVSPETEYCASIFSCLYKLSSIFVTTNYDDYIDKEAINKIGIKGDGNSESQIINSSGPIFYHYEDISSTSILKNGHVIHIHGSISDPKNRELVLTITDYFKAYNAKTSPLPSFLDYIFNEKVVLFVGYSLEEYEILEYMLKGSRQSRDVRHFMLYAVRNEEENFFPIQEKYYADLGIELIKYDISEIGYRQLYDEVCNLAKKVGSKAKPKNKISKLKLVDELL